MIIQTVNLIYDTFIKDAIICKLCSSHKFFANPIHNRKLHLYPIQVKVIKLTKIKVSILSYSVPHLGRNRIYLKHLLPTQY